MSELKENNKLSGRRENRIAAMQFIYMTQLNKGDTLERSLEDFFETKEKPREFYGFAVYGQNGESGFGYFALGGF